jgi:hypothetical protein
MLHSSVMHTQISADYPENICLYDITRAKNYGLQGFGKVC